MRSAIVVALSMLISGCGWVHRYGSQGYRNLRPIAPYWRTNVYLNLTGHEEDPPDSTSWFYDISLVPDTLHTPDSSHIDSVQIFASDDSKEQGSRIEMWHTFGDHYGYIRLARPWPKALIFRVYYALWHRRGEWSVRMEGFYLPHHQVLAPYSFGND